MNATNKLTTSTVGLNIPAKVGMVLDDVATPALIVNLDAFERNVDRMRTFVEQHKIRLRAHAKTHKSADIALIQIGRGGACGAAVKRFLKPKRSLSVA